MNYCRICSLRSEKEFCPSCKEWLGSNLLPTPNELIARKFWRQKNIIWIQYNISGRLEFGESPIVLPVPFICEFSGLSSAEVKELSKWINRTYEKLEVRIETYDSEISSFYDGKISSFIIEKKLEKNNV